ncbi:MAG: DUF59 domain-containing protein [Chitinophagaceae bacterium]
MLSLFKNWNKSKNDPNSRCSSQSGNKRQVEEAPKEDETMEQENKPEEQKIIGIENAVNLHKVEDDPEDDTVFMGNENLSLQDRIELALHTVYDPEIPVNIMELGLVYDIDIKEDKSVFVTMTLTAPGCPVAGDILLEVENKVRAIQGVTDVHVQLTFEPQWNKDMMSEEAKLELGFL